MTTSHEPYPLEELLRSILDKTPFIEHDSYYQIDPNVIKELTNIFEKLYNTVKYNSPDIDSSHEIVIAINADLDDKIIKIKDCIQNLATLKVFVNTDPTITTDMIIVSPESEQALKTIKNDLYNFCVELDWVYIIKYEKAKYDTCTLGNSIKTYTTNTSEVFRSYPYSESKYKIINKHNPFSTVDLKTRTFIYPDKYQFKKLAFNNNATLSKITNNNCEYMRLKDTINIDKYDIDDFTKSSDIKVSFDDTVSSPLPKMINGNKIIYL